MGNAAEPAVKPVLQRGRAPLARHRDCVTRPSPWWAICSSAALSWPLPHAAPRRHHAPYPLSRIGLSLTCAPVLHRSHWNPGRRSVSATQRSSMNWVHEQVYLELVISSLNYQHVHRGDCKGRHRFLPNAKVTMRGGTIAVDRTPEITAFHRRACEDQSLDVLL